MGRTKPWPLFLVLFAGLAGCGSDQLPLADATGTVTLDGQPIAGAKIVFRPDVGPAASGETDAQGHFVLSTYEHADGAIIGKHSVTISSSQSGVALTPGQLPAPPPANTMVLPLRYSRPESSGLSANVQASGDHFTFDLTP